MAGKSKGYVFDAGGLGALDGRDESAKRVLRVLARAVDEDLDVIVSASALAEAYYDGKRQARLSGLLARPYVTVAPLDRSAAKAIVPLRKKTGRDDVVDVHVAWLARIQELSVVTSDPDDIASVGVRADRIVVV